MDDHDVSERVRRLERLEQAKVAAVRYGRFVDRKDVDGLRSEVFTPDAVLRLASGDRHGADAVAEFFATAFAAQPGTRRHFLTNQVAETIAGDEVVVDSYFFFVSEDERSVIGWGNYHDIVTVVDGVGRIREKTITLDVFTDVHTGWAAS